MLANGIKLGYSTSGSSYTNLEGLQEVPEIGSEPEKVDVTCLSDSAKQYELGIGDYGDLEYGFKYDNSSTTSSYRILRRFEESKAKTKFEMSFPDGTKFQFMAQVSLKVSGGTVNGAMTFKVKMILNSDIEVVDPAEPQSVALNKEGNEE